MNLNDKYHRDSAAFIPNSDTMFLSFLRWIICVIVAIFLDARRRPALSHRHLSSIHISAISPIVFLSLSLSLSLSLLCVCACTPRGRVSGEKCFKTQATPKKTTQKNI